MTFEEELDAAIEKIVHDLVSTLGWDQEEARRFIIPEVWNATEIKRTGGLWHWNVTFWLGENVQQSLHDQHVDTSWPSCPWHLRHPLWLAPYDSTDLSWTCSGRVVARLGEL